MTSYLKCCRWLILLPLIALTALPAAAEDAFIGGGVYTNFNDPMPNIELIATVNGAPVSSIFTDQNGWFSVLATVGNHITLTPSYTGCLQFETWDFIVSSGGDSYNFYGTTLGQVTLTCRMFDVDGYPLINTNVTLSEDGGPTQFKVTDFDGYVDFLIPCGADVHLYPDAIVPNPGFSPSEYAIQNHHDRDVIYVFNELTPQVTVTGRIENPSGVGVQGVSVSGFPGGSILTDGSGALSVQVDEGWFGQLTFSKSCFTFSPSSKSVGPFFSDPTNLGVVTVGTPSTQYVISGTVTQQGTSIAEEGVTITLTSNGGQTTTLADGSYSLSVDCGWTGDIVPSLAGRTFVPGHIDVNSPLSANLPNQNFESVVQMITISGSFTTCIGTPIPTGGWIDGMSSGRDFMDANGSFQGQIPAGTDVTLIPALPGWSFVPNPVVVNATTPGDLGVVGMAHENAGGPSTLGEGQISDSSGNPVAGVQVHGEPGGPNFGTIDTSTNAEGIYAWIAECGWSGILTPSLIGYVFEPESIAFGPFMGEFPDFTALPEFEILSPSGTPNWEIGTTQTISWQVNGPNDPYTQMVFWRPNSSSAWQQLLGTADGTIRSIDWEVAGNGGDIAQIKLTTWSGDPEEPTVSVVADVKTVLPPPPPPRPPCTKNCPHQPKVPGLLATSLIGGFPNPFNPSTEIRFSLDSAQRTKISIFDARGQRVRNLVDAHLSAGEHSGHVWNGLDDGGRHVPSGIYYVQMTTESGYLNTRKLALLK